MAKLEMHTYILIWKAAVSSRRCNGTHMCICRGVFSGGERERKTERTTYSVARQILRCFLESIFNQILMCKPALASLAKILTDLFADYFALLFKHINEYS